MLEYGIPLQSARHAAAAYETCRPSRDSCTMTGHLAELLPPYVTSLDGRASAAGARLATARTTATTAMWIFLPIWFPLRVDGLGEGCVRAPPPDSTPWWGHSHLGGQRAT